MSIGTSDRISRCSARTRSAKVCFVGRASEQDDRPRAPPLACWHRWCWWRSPPGMAVVAWPQISDESAWHKRPCQSAWCCSSACSALYAWSKSKEMAELHGLVRGLEQRATAAPDVGQLEKLFELVQRSQRGYRDLIDTFDDLLFSISLDGRIVAANRSFADLVGHPFTDLVGRPLDDLLDLMDGEAAPPLKRLCPAFSSGATGPECCACTSSATPPRDSCSAPCTPWFATAGIRASAFWRMISPQERENEARFTELFETLQEGVYLATADGHFESVNPALCANARLRASRRRARSSPLGFSDPARTVGGRAARTRVVRLDPRP